MSHIAAEVWAQLEMSRPTGENLTARLAVPDRTDRLLCAVDAELQRHLLIPLSSSDQALHDTQSRGLSVETKELIVHGYPPASYLNVTCHDAAGHDVFDLIGSEIAETLSHKAGPPAEIVHRVLAKWRRFWGQFPSQLLSREKQLGLFAELWFLSVWLAPRLGTAQAVNRWRGPFGARHDFEWPGRSVEVKATSSTRGAIHRIHGIEQLAPPDGGELLLFSLRLREEAGASNTLPSLVAACRQQLAGDVEAWSCYESALVQVGYVATHEEEYARMRLRVVAEGLFAVREDFPRLIPAQFPAGVPAGVERVDYEINLGGFERFRVAERPSDPFPL